MNKFKKFAAILFAISSLVSLSQLRAAAARQIDENSNTALKLPFTQTSKEQTGEVSLPPSLSDQECHVSDAQRREKGNGCIVARDVVRNICEVVRVSDHQFECFDALAFAGGIGCVTDGFLQEVSSIVWGE